MKTNFTTTNLQTACAVLSSNTEAIETLKKEHEGVSLFEAAQLFLIEKYNLSQTEAFEVITDLKTGIEEYQTARTAVEANYEETLRKAITDSLKSLNAEEQTRYLASMLTALQLASKTECTQATIDEAVKTNSNKSQDVLIEEIVKALDTLPLSSVAEAAKTLNSESIKAVAEAINKNTTDYRLMAAVQLYAAQREGLLKLEEKQSPLPTNVIGALASASVDAMLATSELQNGTITLSKWQVIVKYILGGLFAVACSSIAMLTIIAVATSVMMFIWSVLGTSLIALLLSFACVLPILEYGVDYTIEGITKVEEWLSPIYDKTVLTITSWATTIFTSIKTWATNVAHSVKERQSEALGQATTNDANTLANNNLALA